MMQKACKGAANRQNHEKKLELNGGTEEMDQSSIAIIAVCVQGQQHNCQPCTLSIISSKQH